MRKDELFTVGFICKMGKFEEGDPYNRETMTGNLFNGESLKRHSLKMGLSQTGSFINLGSVKQGISKIVNP